MSNIKNSIRHIEEPDKSIGVELMEFYQYMKELESDKQRGGKQATLIVMTIKNIKDIVS